MKLDEEAIARKKSINQDTILLQKLNEDRKTLKRKIASDTIYRRVLAERFAREVI